MVSARVATAAVGVLASLAVSLVAWQVFGIPFFFLAVPFVPLLFRRRARGPDDPTAGRAAETPVFECPECGFRTRSPEFAYCPRDGTRLERP